MNVEESMGPESATGLLDVANAMNEAMAASLREQLKAAGVDDSALTDEVVLAIVTNLGRESAAALASNPEFMESIGIGGLLDRPSMFDLGGNGWSAPAGHPFPSSNEPTSLGDMPNGDFQPGRPGGASSSQASTDSGVFERLTAERRTAQIDGFKQAVAGGLNWLSDMLGAAATKFTASPQEQQSFYSSALSALNSADWIELFPGKAYPATPSAPVAAGVPPGEGF